MGEEKELSDKHKAFVDIYLQNGRNATAAYEALYGEKEGTVASTLGSRLFKKVEKSAYFVEKSQELQQKAGVSFDWAVEMNKKILDDAMEGDQIPTEFGFYTKKDRIAALRGVKQITDLFGWEAATKHRLDLEHSGAAQIEVIRKIVK